MPNRLFTKLSHHFYKIVGSPPDPLNPGCRDGIPHIGATSMPLFQGRWPKTSITLPLQRLPGSCKPRTLTNMSLPYPLPPSSKGPYSPLRVAYSGDAFRGRVEHSEGFGALVAAVRMSIQRRNLSVLKQHGAFMQGLVKPLVKGDLLKKVESNQQPTLTFMTDKITIHRPVDFHQAGKMGGKA